MSVITIYIDVPMADKGVYVSYSMSHSMNTYPGSGGTGSVTITNLNQISKPAERLVFLDTGILKIGRILR